MFFIVTSIFLSALYQGNGQNYQYGTTGSIKSPNFPRNYPINLNVTWTIEAPENVMQIVVNFHTFDVNYRKRYYDYLKIEEVNNRFQMFKRCGTLKENEKFLIAKDNKLLFTFVSDNVHTAKGFFLNWAVTHYKSPPPLSRAKTSTRRIREPTIMKPTTTAMKPTTTMTPPLPPTTMKPATTTMNSSITTIKPTTTTMKPPSTTTMTKTTIISPLPTTTTMKPTTTTTMKPTTTTMTPPTTTTMKPTTTFSKKKAASVKTSPSVTRENTTTKGITKSTVTLTKDKSSPDSKSSVNWSVTHLTTTDKCSPDNTSSGNCSVTHLTTTGIGPRNNSTRINVYLTGIIIGGICVVEVTMVAVGIIIYIQRRLRSSDEMPRTRNVEENKYTYSPSHVQQRIAIGNEGHVYEDIPLDKITEYEMQKIDVQENPYVECPDNVYDKAFNKRPHTKTQEYNTYESTNRLLIYEMAQRIVH